MFIKDLTSRPGDNVDQILHAYFSLAEFIRNELAHTLYFTMSHKLYSQALCLSRGDNPKARPLEPYLAGEGVGKLWHTRFKGLAEKRHLFVGLVKKKLNWTQWVWKRCKLQGWPKSILSPSH